MLFGGQCNSVCQHPWQHQPGSTASCSACCVLQGLNKVTNAYLQRTLGANYTARLVGLADFPRVRLTPMTGGLHMGGRLGNTSLGRRHVLLGLPKRSSVLPGPLYLLSTAPPTSYPPTSSMSATLPALACLRTGTQQVPSQHLVPGGPALPGVDLPAAAALHGVSAGAREGGQVGTQMVGWRWCTVVYVGAQVGVRAVARRAVGGVCEGSTRRRH